MATTNSFDVTTGADLQEVDNAVNQATKEIMQRYDFKGTNCSIAFDRAKSVLHLDADDDYRLKALYDVLQSKFVKRGVPLKNMKPGSVEPASGGRVRQEVTLTQGIPTDTAKQIVKDVKAHGGFKKVQVAIQGDQLRVSSPSRDELQEVIAFLKGQDYGIELAFGNYR
ncbi:MAG TPA: YajQ family cyclic di-GMP-binding protein [Longimicrobiales bacterium]